MLTGLKKHFTFRVKLKLERSGTGGAVVSSTHGIIRPSFNNSFKNDKFNYFKCFIS